MWPVALDLSMDAMSDVICLNGNMPMMSGIEYLRALRVANEGKNDRGDLKKLRTTYRTSGKASLRAPTSTT